MNQETPPSPDQPDSAPDTGSQPHPENASDSSQDPSQSVNFEGFAKAVEDAVATGKKDAKKIFDEALPKAKEDLSRGVHDIAYALAYATAFTG
ncbi:MAG: hypothetical protein AAF491_09450, partial [Verrucomicrobiota bacterium]